MGSERGVVVIGRNEGGRLKRCLASIQRHERVVYVDSGSSDHSVALARSAGAHVHELDPTTPFSAARGRQEGVEVLARLHPAVKYVQFVDGDCELDTDWLDTAAAHLDQHADVAIVCGVLSERPSESLLYCKLSPQTWKQTIGDIAACGGVFMIRKDVYQTMGGFNPALLTQEERDLCTRIRAAGHRIVRLESPMAQHDSGITCFRQWWARAVWGGYGDALSIRTSPGVATRVKRSWVTAMASLILLVTGVVGMLWTRWFAIVIGLGIAAIALQFARIAAARLRQGDSAIDALQFSAFAILRTIAGAIGFLQYHLERFRLAKRPDHRAVAQ